MSDETLDEPQSINLENIILNNPVINDTLLELGADNLTHDKPIGIFSQYIPELSLDSYYSGIIKDPNNQRWKFFSGMTDKPTETDTDFTGVTLDNIQFTTAYGNLSGTATNFSGSLSGDITGTQSATVVAFVGGSTASTIHTNMLQIAAATSDATPSTLVKRNALGDVSFNSITCSNITVNGGSSFIDSTITTIGDNIIMLAKDNIANTVDIGFIAKYLSSDPSPVTYYQGLVKDVSVGRWKIFSALDTNPSTTIDFNVVSLDDFECDAILANSIQTTTLSSTSTNFSTMYVDRSNALGVESLPLIVVSGSGCFSSGQATALYYNGSNSSLSAGLTLRTSGGTKNTPVATATGNTLGQITFHGSSSDFLSSSSVRISATALDNFTSNIYGASLSFDTVAPTTNTLTNRMFITADSSNNTLVGIGTNSPNSSLALDVTSTSKSFAPPRMTNTQRDAITTPVNGSLVYNTTANCFSCRSNGSWVDLPMGGIYQVVSALTKSFNNAVSTTGGAYTTVPGGLSINITPGTTSRRIRLTGSFDIRRNSSDWCLTVIRTIAGTPVNLGTSQNIPRNGGGTVDFLLFGNNDRIAWHSLHYIDTPGVTSQVTYTVQIKPDTSGGTVVFNGLPSPIWFIAEEIN